MKFVEYFHAPPRHGIILSETIREIISSSFSEHPHKQFEDLILRLSLNLRHLHCLFHLEVISINHFETFQFRLERLVAISHR